jgi:hypothetical protein
VAPERLPPGGTGGQADGNALAGVPHIAPTRPRRKTNRLLPSSADMPALRRIAGGGGVIVTFMRNGSTVYSLRDGSAGVPAGLVERLVRIGALLPDDRGLFDRPQS